MNSKIDWRTKMQDVLQTCQDEIKKTTEMGKKMLQASRANSSLHEAYEELGKLAMAEITAGNLKWEEVKVQELVTKIKNYEANLQDLEKEISRIKFPHPQEESNSKE